MDGSTDSGGENSKEEKSWSNADLPGLSRETARLTGLPWLRGPNASGLR